jgi:hypothetical protein
VTESAWPRVARAVAAGALCAFGAAACRGNPDAAKGPFGDKVAEDVPKIEKATGLKFKTPPHLELRSRQQVREFLLQTVNEPQVEKALDEDAMAYKLLGMVPDTLHLRDLYVRLLTEQIIGYYDPKTKVLYVVKGAPEEYVGETILHELVHALQDQYANLDSLEHIQGDDDREAAIAATIEGEATFWQIYLTMGWQGDVPAHLPGGWDQIRAQIARAKTTQPVLGSAPFVIQESLLFPYINGADFVKRFATRHPHVSPLTALPQSTEQVIHDGAYFGAKPDLPSTITLPPVASEIAQNDMGEFGTRLFFFQHLGASASLSPDSVRSAAQPPSVRAAAGWDGDRYALVKTSSGNALAWVTVWDSPVDAAEFTSTLDDVMMQWRNVKPVISGTDRKYDDGTRTVQISSRTVAGRAVVLYVDVPSGTSTNILDLSKVQVVAR